MYFRPASCRQWLLIFKLVALVFIGAMGMPRATAADTYGVALQQVRERLKVYRNREAAGPQALVVPGASDMRKLVAQVENEELLRKREALARTEKELQAARERAATVDGILEQRAIDRAALAEAERTAVRARELAIQAANANPFGNNAVGAQARAGRAPQLSQLLLAKIEDHDDVHRMIVMIDAYRQEMRLQTVTSTQIVAEEREVPDNNGNMRKVVVRRAVPLVEEKEVPVRVPFGRRPQAVELKEVQFYDLEGNRMDVATAKEKLTTLKPIFFIDNMQTNPIGFSDVIRQSFHSDCLIAVTHKSVREVVP